MDKAFPVDRYPGSDLNLIVAFILSGRPFLRRSTGHRQIADRSGGGAKHDLIILPYGTHARRDSPESTLHRAGLIGRATDGNLIEGQIAWLLLGFTLASGHAADSAVIVEPLGDRLIEAKGPRDIQSLYLG